MNKAVGEYPALLFLPLRAVRLWQPRDTRRFTFQNAMMFGHKNKALTMSLRFIYLFIY